MIVKLIKQIQQFFEISRKEARGSLVLIILTILIIWSPFVFRRWILPHFPLPKNQIDTTKFNTIVADLERDISHKKSKSYPEKNDSYKNDSRPKRIFKFNPNLVTVEEFEELGIPLFIAKRIENYRNKGGQFRKKEDLLRIYDFPADVYKKLESYIVLPVSAPNISNNTPSRTLETPKEKRYSKTSINKIAAFDINTADTSQLIKLKGIGLKLSTRIIKFRDALGGFHSKEQFAEIYGLDTVAIASLNTYANIISPVKKIKINQVSATVLTSHSYLRNKKQAEIIINYRNQHGKFSKIEDLEKVRILNTDYINKIAPYLDFE